MNVKPVLATASLLAAAFALSPAVQADVLAVPAATHHQRRAHTTESGRLPSRGMSMAQVERRYGAPLSKLAPAGGDTPRHPTINRWRYAGYTVYFERNRVLHSVLDDALDAPRS